MARRTSCGTRAARSASTSTAPPLVDPLTSPHRDGFAQRYFELRKHRGLTEERAFDAVTDPSYFGTLMVTTGAVDGMVSGASHTTGDTIRPAFEIIKAREGMSVVSSVFFMCLPDRVLVYGDCAVNPNPDPRSSRTSRSARRRRRRASASSPRIAMLSYSTGNSAKGRT